MAGGSASSTRSRTPRAPCAAPASSTVCSNCARRAIGSSTLATVTPTSVPRLKRLSSSPIADLCVVQGVSTPTAWIFTDRRGNQIAIVDQGPMKFARKYEVLTHTVETAEIVHLGTGRPEYYVRIAALASKLGKRIAFDPSQEIHYVYTPVTFRRLLSRPTTSFGNEATLKRALSFVRRKKPADLLEW